MDSVTKIILDGMAVLFVGFLLLPLRYIYDYEIEGDRIAVKLFSTISVMRIRINDILEIRECSFKELLMPSFALRLGNRRWGQSIMIRKRRGLCRTVIMAPDNAAEFIEEVRRIQDLPIPLIRRFEA
jgi:hypothetical protein